MTGYQAILGMLMCIAISTTWAAICASFGYVTIRSIYEILRGKG